MFWVRIQDIILFYAIILVLITWIIIMCLLYNLFKEEKIEKKKYDIDHKLIKDIKVRKEDKK